MTEINLKKYEDYVSKVTSGASVDLSKFKDRLDVIASYGINVPLLMTGGLGLGSEAGEFSDLVKKVFFQEKVLDDETLVKMKKELGDVIWYWVNSCRALGLDPYDVISSNIEKLEARYPDRKFNVVHSENRKVDDV